MNELERELFALLSAEEYGTRIRKAGVYLFPSDYRFDPHAHPEYEINYINTGHCIMSVGEDYAALRQGECIVVAPGMLHGFMVDGQKPCRITQLELVIRGPERAGGILEFPGMTQPFHRLRDEGLLWHPEYSITDVAMQCGFSSSQYFCRVFRRMAGQTPAQYRGKWRECPVTAGEDETEIG